MWFLRKNIVLMLLWFKIIRKIGGMKRLFSVIICVVVAAVLGESCFATLHPVEGSTNFLVTDDEPGASDCADIQFVFARGSGAMRNESGEWRAFEDAMSVFARKRNYSFAVTDLDYPAISVTSPFTNALGAVVSAGQYYKFGQSV